MLNVKYLDIFNTYIKWKNIIYYSNNLLYKKKIVDFEASDRMESVFSNIASYINDPNSCESKKYIFKLIEDISFYVLPKTIKYNKDENNNILISSNEDKNGYLEKVNFFIDAPIEIYIIDFYLTLNIGLYAHNNNKILYDLSYSNKFKTSVFRDGQINYKERETFEIYFYQYQKWRNNAFDTASKVLENNSNVVIFNYDIKSFYYNACIKFNEILNFLPLKMNVYIDFFVLVYDKYKNIIRKYKKDIYQHKKNEYMLPIGLESSKLFGDLYLFDYDLLKSGLGSSEYNVAYYGRYVDDILIVVETKEHFTNKEECINKVNEKLKLFINDRDSIYLSMYPHLELQKAKTDVYFFRSTDKNKYMHVYGAKMRTQASNIGDFFDDDFIDKDYVDLIYKNDRSTFYTKFSDIKSSRVDKLALSRYLTKALNLYKFSDFNKNETDEILNIISYELSFLNLIDNFSLIEKIFKLLIVLGYNETTKFYKEQRSYVVQKLDIDKIVGIIKNKKISKIIRESLAKSIDIAYYLAVCINPKLARKNQDLFLKYRKSLMFDKKLVCVPFTQFYDSKYVYNLMDSSNVEYIFESEFNETAFKLCPYTPTFPEYELYIVLRSIYKNEEIDYGKNFQNYWKLINKTYSKQPLWNYNKYYKGSQKKYFIQNNLECDKLRKIKIYHEPSLNIPNINDAKGKKQKEIIEEKQKEMGKLKEIGISIASLPLSIENIYKKIYKRKSYKSIKYKRQIFKVLNESKRHKDTHFIVFPELSIPLDWLTDLIFYCKNYNKSIIFGMSYIFQKKEDNYIARNIVGSINYYKDKGTYKHAKVILKEKNFYPYEEKMTLEEMGYICKDAENPFYYVVDFRGVKYSFMVCFELTDIDARALLRGYINNLFVPVLNKDTAYFSNIVNSTARDLYCYVSMANTSKYGDSRITAPFDTVHKDIVQIKGGDNAFCIIGKVDIKTLNENIENQEILNRNRYNEKKKQKKKDKSSRFKPLSAGKNKNF